MNRLKDLVIAVGASLGYFILNGPLSNYRIQAQNFMQKFKLVPPAHTSIYGDKPMMSPELDLLFNEVLQDCFQLTDQQKTLIKAHPVYSLRPWYEGSVHAFSAAVGIPDYFNLFSTSELKSNRLNGVLKADYKWKIKDDKLWFTKDGLSLIDSFVLSSKAKKFAMAREVHGLDSKEIFVKSGLVLASAYAYFAIRNYCETKYNISAAMLPQRNVFRLLFILLVYSFYLSASNIFKAQLLADMDAKAITKGLSSARDLNSASKSDAGVIDIEYYEGAKEYYAKVQQRNVALRNLIQESTIFLNPKRFQFRDNGDERSSVFDPRLPISSAMLNLVKWKQAPSSPADGPKSLTELNR